MDNDLGGSWGKSIAIDLHNCDLTVISDPERIKQFITEIIKVIDMKAHGPTYIDRFGSGELEGWSAMQFIETSSITVHADEPGRRCFVDVFSCKEFDETKAETFAKNFFGATESKATTLMR